jgi:hypothetical protein
VIWAHDIRRLREALIDLAAGKPSPQVMVATPHAEAIEIEDQAARTLVREFLDGHHVDS